MVFKPGKVCTSSIILICFLLIVLFFVSPDTSFYIVTCSILVIIAMRGLISMGRTLLFDANGCTVSFLWYKRVYKWDDLQTKYIESYRYLWKNGISCQMKGILFSEKNIYKPKWMMAGEYSAFFRPISAFYVYLVPKEELEKNPKLVVEYSYLVDETFFLEKMEEWNVVLEKRGY